MTAPRIIELQLHVGRMDGKRTWIFAYGAELRLPWPLVDYTAVRELQAYIMMLVQSQDEKA